MTKDNLVIWPIIRYVTCLVSQAGETPQLLPGELVLCEKFGVALKGQVGKSNTLAKSRLWQSTTSDTCSGYDIGAYKAHPGGMSMVHLDGSGCITKFSVGPFLVPGS